MKILKNLLPIVIIIMLSYWSVKPFFNSGFFEVHDDTQVARVFQMHKSLIDGQFPVRWVADLGYGYGYPIFNFYAPFAYYMGAMFMLLGFNALIATKLMMTLGIILSGIFMYLLAKQFWGKPGGVIAGLLYVFAPYHALNIYVRGAVAEYYAYAFIPLAFLGIYKISENLKVYLNLKSKSKHAGVALQNVWIWVCISALSYAAIITSHNLTAMMATPFLFIFAAFFYVQFRMGKRIFHPYLVFLGLLIGILLSAFYWLPVLFEMKFTNVLSVVGGGSDYRDHFVCPLQLWSSQWGFAGSGPGCTDGFSLMVGKIHILLSIFAIPALYIVFKKHRSKFYVSLLFSVFLLFSIFLTLKESRFIWDAIPHMAFFQFPWRFLVLISFFLSFFGGAIANFSDQAIKGMNLWRALVVSSCAALSIIIVYFNSDLFIPQKMLSVKPEDYVSQSNLNWKISRISDEYMPKGFFKPLRSVDVPKQRFEFNDKNLKILTTHEKTQHIHASIEAQEKSTIYVNLAYFPGWHVFIDNKQVWFKHSGRGLHIDVPKGTHAVDIKFTQTSVEKIANALSIAGVLMLIVGIIIHKKKFTHD